MYILGISAYYHDSAAALLKDGKIVASCQEERFTRIKHDFAFPHNAIQACIKLAGIGIEEIDYVVFYEKPFLKFERLIKSFLYYAPFGLSTFLKAIPVWMKEKLWIKSEISDNLGEKFKGKILFCHHHESHAASAFFPSPFQDAAILTVDGVGEWTTTSIGSGNGNKIKILKNISFPHSLGLLYSAFTYYCGFKVNSGEYKLMGLAPYGEPKYVNLIKENLITIKEDGSFNLNLKYFDFMVGLRMVNSKFENLLGQKARNPESALSQFHMDVAKSIQVVTEEILIKLAKTAKKITGSKNLVLAGGCALNCVANGKIEAANIFENIWIQPASGDAGGALGAAVAAYYGFFKKERSLILPDAQSGSLLGDSFSDVEIESLLNQKQAVFHKLTEVDLLERLADLIDKGSVVGWFNGRMEYGPRALGARSILGDARSKEMQKTMNLKIKFRESFRPFAPIIMEEEVRTYFKVPTSFKKSPYMLLVHELRDDLKINKEKLSNEEGLNKLYVERSNIPAITHVDYSARIQTVSMDENPKMYRLLKKFKEKTNSPVLINTSFNVRGEPIVHSPEDAYRCFMRTHIDVLVLENYLLLKKEQPKEHLENSESWMKEFSLD